MSAELHLNLPSVPLPETMTTDEAAELLRICPRDLRNLAREKKIPCRKVGKSYRFHRPTVIEWLNGVDVRDASSAKGKR